MYVTSLSLQMKAFDERRCPSWDPVFLHNVPCTGRAGNLLLSNAGPRLSVLALVSTHDGSGFQPRRHKCFRHCSNFGCLRQSVPTLLYLELLLNPVFHNSYCVHVRNATIVAIDLRLLSIHSCSDCLFKTISYFFTQ